MSSFVSSQFSAVARLSTVALLSFTLCLLVPDLVEASSLVSLQDTAPATGLTSPALENTEAAASDSLSDALREAVVAVVVMVAWAVLVAGYRFHGGRKSQPSFVKPAASKLAEGPERPAPSAPAARQHSPSASAASSGPRSRQLRSAPAPSSSYRSSMPARAPTSADTNFLVGAVRAGRFRELPALMDEAYARAERAARGDVRRLRSQATEHLLSCLRACASSRRFREALDLYWHVAARVDSAVPAVWSLLLYSAVESGAFEQGRRLLASLPAMYDPLANYDLVNAVRCYAHFRDGKGLRSLLLQQELLGGRPDGLTRNRALGACVNAGALDMADVLLGCGAWGRGMDTIAYNTLMKGYARSGQLARCHALRAEMEQAGLEATEVTYGTLLDACISAKDFTGAKGVFADLSNSNVRMNAVHLTTFIKGLVAAGHFEEASDMVQDMLRSPGTEPDVVTYSTLAKAYADRGRSAEAMSVLDQMIAQGVTPDEVIFHSVLIGCSASAHAMQPGEITRVLERLLTLGLRPSSATLSIVAKAFSQGGFWDEAQEALDAAERRWGLAAEPRIYGELAQAFLRSQRQGGWPGEAITSTQRVLRFHESMLSCRTRNHQDSIEAAHQRLLKYCQQSGRHDLATKLIGQASFSNLSDGQSSTRSGRKPGGCVRTQ